MTLRIATLLLLLGSARGIASMAGPYAPAAGVPGSTAIGVDDPRILGWASGWSEISRGFTNIADPGAERVSWGKPQDALGVSDVLEKDVLAVVTLGDGGQITVTFNQPIGNGPGPDFAIFENGFEHESIAGQFFLELGFVEVSSDGSHFHRFPSVSLTQTDTQLDYLGTLDPTNLHNLAGKYARGFGTPFDLAELADIEGLDISNITHVRIIDVVGSLDANYRTLDSLGNPINDPWTTDFPTGGFDLDAVAVLNIPEPAAGAFLLLGVVFLGQCRRR